MAIRIVVADDHPFILDGLEQLFRGESDCEIVARCPNGEEALQAVEKYRPDLLILDVRMPRLDGIELLRKLHERQSPVRVVLLPRRSTMPGCWRPSASARAAWY